MTDFASHTTIASIICAAAFAVLIFRVQREADMKERGEPTWFPWCDWVMLGALHAAAFSILLPIFDPASSVLPRLAWSLLAGSIVCLLGYPWAVLAHYRLVLGGSLTGDRPKVETPEKVVVLATAVLAAVMVAVTLATT